MNQAIVELKVKLENFKNNLLHADSEEEKDKYESWISDVKKSIDVLESK